MPNDFGIELFGGTISIMVLMIGIPDRPSPLVFFEDPILVDLRNVQNPVDIPLVG